MRNERKIKNMKINKNKVMGVALVGGAVACALAPSFASDINSTGSVTPDTITMTNNGSPAAQETTVTYLLSSSYSVVIPKNIVLDAATKASDYTVKVSGDISSDKKITVTPDATFAMKDQATAGTKKADVTAAVTQAKKDWTSAEVCKPEGTTTSGNISAAGLTSGNWKGTFQFNIALGDA